MSNRLADLEQHITQRTTRNRPVQRQESLRSALRTTQQPSSPAQVTPVKGLSARVSRWPSRPKVSALTAKRAQAYSSLNYEVPGVFEVIAQPTGMSCWATVFTMLKMWRNQQSMSIESALGAVGQRWVDIYNADSGLSSSHKPDFIASAGLVAEPPQSFGVEGWEQLLRNYGPIWVTTDEAAGKPWAIHARIITGIYGDGTAEGTRFKIVDPSGGRRYEEAMATFIPKYEEEVVRTGHMRIQVVHWQADGRSEQQALTLGRNTATLTRPLDLSAALSAQQKALALGAIDVRYNVPLVPQLTGMSCWAAAFAMIVGWRDQMSVDYTEIVRGAGYWQQYQQGLNIEDHAAHSMWGLVPESPQSYTVEGFADLLRNYGPLWVASAEPGGHVRVVTGMQGDGTPDGTTLYINDPWEQGMTSFRVNNQGSQITETYIQFVKKQAALADRTSRLPDAIFVSHLPQLPSWMNSSTAQNFSYFMGRPIAMESPSNPENFRLLTSGVWNSNTTLTVQGGQAMWFKIRNTNVLGTTISITDQARQNKQSIILPLTSVEFVFSIFGSEPMGWRFDVSTNSDAFMVTWELWSTWVAGDPPNG